jgi:ribosome-binding factor A
MTTGRMRRVDEAMREVLSAAITSELKDPRVGFVTVTALQRRVADELHLKHTPALEFAYDDTAERGQRIAELIEREDKR